MAAAVIAAGVIALTVFMSVVITMDVRIITQTAGEQGLHRGVRFSADAAIELDARLFRGLAARRSPWLLDDDVDDDHEAEPVLE